MRLLGDEYIKAEFRAHRDVENPVHLVRHSLSHSHVHAGSHFCVQIGFLTEWQLYAQKIEGESWVGEKLDEGKIAKMSGMKIFLLVDCDLGLRLTDVFAY